MADRARYARSPLNGIRQMSGLLGPVGWVPLVVLAALSAVERFDATAFAVLGPEIRDTFHLSNGGFTTIATFSLVLPILLAVPVGYGGDRFNRIRLSAVGAVVWGVTAIFTGLAPALAILIVARLAGGVGQLVNEPVHASLLSDYYPPEGLSGVFAVYRLGSTGAQAVAGVLAGALGAAIGWRPTFVILAIPTLLLVAVLLRLRDPARGASLAVTVPDEERASMGEGYRRVRAIRSLRRTWVAAFFFGAGTLPFVTYLSLFFKDVYHLGSVGRGNITAVYNVFSLAGILLGGYWAQSSVRRQRPELLPIVNGGLVISSGIGMLAMAAAPWQPVSIAAVCFLAMGIIGFLPAYQTMVALVAPPRLRSQAFAWSLLWYAGGALLWTPIVGSIGDAHGERVAVFVLGLLVTLGGAIETTVRAFVGRDIDQAVKAKASADTDALLACRGVDMAYDRVQVLFDVSFDVQKGEILALLGTNGAGKSTLLKGISGLVDPIGGSIFFEGRDITHADARQTSGLGIVQVPGGRGVFPTLTVGENMRAAGWMYRKDRPRLREATERVLEYFPILRDRWDTPAGNLSGGEQQMLSLGQAFIARPRLLLIDELSLGLAPTVVERLLGIVEAIHDNGTTVILVEQSVNLALRLAKRALFMEKGEIRFSGLTSELLDRPDVLRAVFLQGAASANGHGNGSGASDRDSAVRGAQTKAMETAASRRRRTPAKPTKSDLEDRARRAAILEGPVVLETHGLTKRYGGIAAVSDVDLALHQGEILGLIGPNGAGKTTIFDLVCGFTPADGGRVIVNGADLSRRNASERAAAGVGRSFQDARLWPSLTVREAIAVAFERSIETPSAVAALFHLPAVTMSEDDLNRRVEEVLRLLGLRAFRDKFVSELSTGSRRMVEIAAILAHRPSVLLLDEPSSGIAQKETEALGPLLRQVQRHLGCSMLVIEHDMPLITGLADHLVALDRGSVVTHGLPQEVLHHPTVVESYLGTRDERDVLPGRSPVGAKR